MCINKYIFAILKTRVNKYIFFLYILLKIKNRLQRLKRLNNHRKTDKR